MARYFLFVQGSQVRRNPERTRGKRHCRLGPSKTIRHYQRVRRRYSYSFTQIKDYKKVYCYGFPVLKPASFPLLSE